MKKNTSYILLFFLCCICHNTLFAQDTIVVRDSDLTGGFITWTNANIYLLDGNVILEGGILNIQPGTKILAKDENSGLIIRPEARMIARGTADAPIVFSSESVEAPNLNSDSGLWRGLTLQGNENSSSSLLSYVSIAFAGAKINGQLGTALFLDHIGQTTPINHIEIMASAGDGIRIRGGEVEIAYAAVSFAQDDAFDWDFGWRGKGLYWFAYNMGGSAIEGKGNLGPNGRTSSPEIYNSTFTSSSCRNADFSAKAVINLKDNTGGLIANSIFAHFPKYGIQVEDLPSGPDARQQLENGNLQIKNNIWWGFAVGDQLDASSNGIIKVDASAEDPQASFLSEHLQKESNVYAGPGLKVNRMGFSGDCYALDPRPHAESKYSSLANAPYPDDSFFNSNVVDKNQKGSFSESTIWLEPWSQLEQTIFLGDDARASLGYFENELPVGVIFSGDTITIQCDSLANFHNKIGEIPGVPCKPIIILLGSSSRRGNKRRPKNGDPLEDELTPAFIEDWEYASDDFGCHLIEPISFTLIVIDTIPPTIHPIPDENGGLTAFSQDCDESWITHIQKDTLILNNGIRITYTFTAEDYSGNTSTLVVEKDINVEKIRVYADLDGDGFGNHRLRMICSSVPIGFVTNNLDCNDDDPNINPNTTSNTPPNCPANNDLCIYAAEITLGSGCTSFNMFSSTPSIYLKSSSNCGVTNVFADIWAKFQAPTSGQILMNFNLYNDDIGRGNSFMLELFNGTCENLTLINCIEGDFNFEASIGDLVPGDYYFLRIIELTNNPATEFTICLTEETRSVSNNDCENATTINQDSEDSCISVNFDNSLATNSGITNLTECSVTISRDVWFIYEVNSSDTITISLQAEDSRAFSSPLLNIYFGPCDDLTPITCAFNFAPGQVEVELYDLLPGEKLWIQAAEFRSYSGEYLLEICSSPSSATSTTESVVVPNIQLFPNPATGNLFLQLDLPIPTTGSAALYDMTGKKVKTLFAKQPLSGSFSTELEIGELDNGIYLFQLQTPEGNFVEKIVILK